MRESTLLVAPPQAPSRPGRISDNGVENPLLDLRRRRAVALMPTVRRVEGGFRVSSSTREISYLVTQPNRRLICTCADYQRFLKGRGFRWARSEGGWQRHLSEQALYSARQAAEQYSVA